VSIQVYDVHSKAHILGVTGRGHGGYGDAVFVAFFLWGELNEGYQSDLTVFQHSDESSALFF
jgi:hypothetical protein